MRSIIPLRRLTLALACGSLFATGAALAQDAQQTPPPTGGDSSASSSSQQPQGASDFKKLDANADGYVSKDEAVADAALTSDFAKRDVDGDGKLSESEFATSSSTPPPTDDAGKKKP